MSTPAPKRRRLNGPSALHKPFKSPFRTPLKTTTNHPDTPPSSDGPDQLSKPSLDSNHASETKSIISTPQLPAHRPKTPKSVIKPSNPASKASSAPYNASLASQISRTRTSINTITQAIQLLENPASDSNLEDLIDKWRTASRAAAEELYSTSRDRVNRMGGVGAWRDRERDQKKKMIEWEEEALDQEEIANTTDDDDDEEEDEEDEAVEGEEPTRKLTEEEKEMRKEAKKEARKAARERKEYMREQLREKKRMQETIKEPGSDDDSFTLDMMLKALNVDLNVIGYSKELQQWVG